MTTQWDRATGALDIATLKALFASGSLTPESLIDAIYDRIAARGDDHVWIHLIDRETSKARARALLTARASPLHPAAACPTPHPTPPHPTPRRAVSNRSQAIAYNGAPGATATSR